MERYRKKDMLQTVDTLLRANDAIIKTVRSNPQGAAEALTQCQESAIALGTYIDTLGEKYEELVHILEDYCENVYQMSEHLSDENVCRKVSKKIQKQMSSLKNSIKYDLPEDRKEIVFLPYKASMWDSLESVWKAADADENTDAYVIPIPYFDKNPDGTFREEHYEGDQYPKYVPVTRYDEYDLEARRPDVIYIHNPYDECNHVTSVHPYFYSKNLRNFTDKLVYIPYFVLGEIDPGDQAAIDGMKHFCFTPGTIYADQVIVQSESMRQIYINEYMKAAKEMGLPGEHVDRKFLEKKFLGTGSPKIDKVLNTRKEDLEIPAEWLRIIEKPDGSWKKIVFYNTSVSALLQHSEKMLRKMVSVFEIFKENRDEVALLWRPHPLIQATIESMRPRLWEGYQEIRDRYVQEGWGIYDDSADLDRAVVISDAYYGDGSSVVRLYREKNVPILIQDPESFHIADSQLFLSSYFCSIAKDYLIVLSQATNAVLVLSKKGGHIEKIFTLEEEKFVEGLYLTAFCEADRLIAIPYHANDFRIIDLCNGNQKKMEGYITDTERHKREKFLTAIVCGRHLWICGENIKRIVCIDVKTLKVLTEIAFSEIHGLEHIADKIVWGINYIVAEDHIFLAGRNYGVILEIDNRTKKAFVRARENVEGFSCLYEYGGKMLLVDQNGYEYQYHSDEDYVIKTNKKYDEACWRCVVVGDRRYYFEAFSGKIICIDEDKTEEIIYESGQDHMRIGAKFQFVVPDDKYIYFQERFSGRIYALDTQTNICIRQKIDPSDYAEELQRKTLEQSKDRDVCGYRENEWVSVETLLKYLKESQTYH